MMDLARMSAAAVAAGLVVRAIAVAVAVAAVATAPAALLAVMGAAANPRLAAEVVATVVVPRARVAVAVKPAVIAGAAAAPSVLTRASRAHARQQPHSPKPSRSVSTPLGALAHRRAEGATLPASVARPGVTLVASTYVDDGMGLQWFFALG